jgi:regulator of cell morphogenesis and NO signaling
MTDLQTMTIKDIVTRDYRAATILERYSLDFCCGGAKTISQACSEKSLDPTAVLEDLKRLSETAAGKSDDFTTMPLDKLIDHILVAHHEYVRRMLPILLARTQKVAGVHGERHPEVMEIAKRFAVVAHELRSHMMKEENILFPYIKMLLRAAASGGAVPFSPLGSVRNPIRMMEQEHHFAGNELYEIRALSCSYTPPEDACATLQVTYHELQEFERDLHQHVHLENNVLFPRAITLEDTHGGNTRQ